MSVRVLELYPADLSLNGDVGNRTALVRRMRLAGIAVEELSYSAGDELPETADIVLIGTGSSSAVRSIAVDVDRIAPTLRAWSEAGVVIVGAGAGFHLLSTSIRLSATEVIPGAGVFAGSVDNSSKRIITEAFALDSDFGLIIGTENHTSVYTGRPDQKALGRVRNGFGNGDGTDGVRVHNSIGTHCHGPFLVLNPIVTDALITIAAERAGLSYQPGPAHADLDQVVDLARNILIAKLPS
ncbi:cobyric acid synthase [Mycetocola manganoxydans]|uniref:Cobyric acid synthase n=1 Tax=Mycetocola manganoxydans TaxID=699879 RepID=A0A3L6ZXF7_9MICO|nr:cobyric acid synthase [Mycetocola manganoxydans]RLP72589.1 cobyric acid synthase [Mycetocola manganoxydans]GHD39644.1 glutamine amidotransferase [Mycetocola manganoxydans]